MKKINRWLSILMCFCMLCTSMPADYTSAFAEGEAEAILAQVDDPVLIEQPEQDSSVNEQEVALEAEPVNEAPEEIPNPEPTEEPSDEMAVEDEFSFGYVKVVKKAELAEDSDGEELLGTIASGSILLVVKRSERGTSDRAKVVYSYEGTAEDGWVDFDMLEPLVEDEIAAFQKKIEEPLFYEDDPDYPLPEPEIDFEKSAEDTEKANESPVDPDAESSEATSGSEKSGTDSAVLATETIEIFVTPESAYLLRGETLNFACTVPEGASGTIEYYVSDENIAAIDQNGNLTALNEGECIVTAVLRQGDEAVTFDWSTVLVYDIDELVAFVVSDLKIGETAEIEIEIPDDLKSRVEYASSATDVVSVDADGKITAVAPGKADIAISLGNLLAEIEVQVLAPADSFELSIDKSEINLGETAQLTLVVPESTHGVAEYATKDSLVVAVDPATGLVMAVGPGKAELTATMNGITKSVFIEVYGKPTALNLSLGTDTLSVGYLTHANVSLSEYIITEITYRSSDESIAVVDENGVVTAISAGYCEIIAEADNDVKESATLHVISSSVDLNVKYHEMAVGETLSLDYTVSDESLSSTAVFGSSDASVATVDPVSGIVKAIAPGEATITLTLGDTGLTANCHLTIRKAPSDLTILDAAKTIGVGQVTPKINYLLSADGEPTCGSVKFKSSSTKIVQVNSSGQLKGVKAGTATITLTAYNGVSASFKVTVKKAPSKLTISPASAVIAVGQSMKISHTLTKNTSAGISYASSDENVVTVDDGGNITAISEGSAKIRVSTHNGLKKYLSVTVNKAPENVTLSLSAAKLGVGMTATAKADTDISSDVAIDYEYWTDNPEIISVNTDTGAIEALATGSANVFVRTYNGVSSHAEDGDRVETKAQVEVVPMPDNVTIDGAEFNIISGKTIKLPVSMTMNDGSTDCMTTYTLATSSKKIAVVNNKGQVKGIKAGTATITLTAANGDVATCKVVVMNSPKKVVLNKSSLTIGENMSSRLAAKVYYSSSKYYTHTAEDALGMGKFSSNNESVVRIDAATGEFTSVAPGTAKLTYKTLNGKSASCEVTVLGRPTEIGVNAATMKLGANMTATVKAIFKDGEMGDVVFRSSDSSVATVDAESGKVTAVSEGTAVITVDAGNGVTTSCEIHVVPMPDKVTIDGAEFKIISGKTIKLPVSMTMTDGSADCMTTYTLTSSSKKIAVTNANGQVKGIKTGTATITLTAANGDVATCKVVVMNSPKKVVLNKSSMTIGEDMTSILAAKVYYSSKKYYIHSAEDALGMGKFSSSDDSIVSIDAATGEFSAIAPGTAKLTYKTLNGKSASCNVTVYAAPTSLNLSDTQLALGEGMSASLGVTFNEFERGELSYASSDSSVAIVSDSGRITAVNCGETKITVSALNGVEAVCNVKVLHGPDQIKLNITSSNMAVKGKIALKPAALYNGSTDECKTTFTYASSNTKIATVTADGIVKGVKSGNATIRVMAANGMYADCKIAVRKTPSKVTFPNSIVYVGIGQRIRIEGKIHYSGGSCIYQPGDTSYAQMKIDDASIASIDPVTGEIIGLEVGRTYLHLKTYNGKTAKCGIVVAPGPEWISLDNAFLTLSRGETFTLNCLQSASSVTSIDYASSDSSIVSVAANGISCKITALAQGSATITATSANGKTSTCQVTVLAKPDAINFESDTMALGLNDTARLPKVLVTSIEGECSQAVAYSSSSVTVAVDAAGNVTGVEPGTAIITASTYNGLTAICIVTVQPEPTQMTLTAQNSLIAVGDNTKLSLKMNAAGSSTYSVDDPSILKVDSKGNVTALSPGTAVITATAYNGCSASCTIEVLAVPEWICVDTDRKTIAAGSSFQLNTEVEENTLGKVAFVSTNENAATVDTNGKVTAVAPGDAVIRAYVVGHETVFDTCEVSVLAKPTQISLSESQLKLCKGTSTKLQAAFSCESGADCYGKAVYATSNKKVVTVDQNGTIKAVGVGEATITASLDSDKSIKASCKITVVKSSVGFNASVLRMSIGETRTLDVYLPDGEKSFSLMSSQPDIVSVNTASRTVKAVGEGSVTITARNGSDTAVCTIEVTRKPESISISSEEKSIAIGNSFALDAMLYPEGTAALLTYASANPAVAKVSDAGIVEAVSCGTTVIYISNYDGSLSAQCAVRVVYEPELIRFGELSDIIIAAGDSYVLEKPIMYNASGDSDCDYTLAISDPDCAVILLQNGRYILQALNEGEATLRLKSSNGRTASLKVKVIGAPESIAFESDAIYAAVGEKIVPSVTGSNGVSASVSFSSDNGCVIVTDDGSLQAVYEGTAQITAASRAFSGLKATTKVHVLKSPESFMLAPASMTMAVGEYSQLTPRYNEGAASANLNYSSSDETIVRVGKDGSVRAVGEGTAVVTATAFGGKTAVCAITVKTAPTSLSIQPAQISACIHDQIQLTALFGSSSEYANLSYESGNKTVASVDERGLVTFGSEGETYIRVSTFNGKTVDVPVVVGATPGSVSFANESAVLLVRDSAKLSILFDKGTAHCTITSSDPAIAWIDAEGVVHALKPGTVTITLNVPALHLNAQCELTVVNQLEGISIFGDKTTLQLHETTTLSCELLPANTIGSGLVAFTSSDPSIAEVDRDSGLVTGMAYGTAVITAAAADGSTTQYEINVLGGKRRMLIAYYFGESGDAGYLPFAYNNGYSMASAFAASTVEGQKYDIKGPMSNEPKAELFRAIRTHFADATEDDVSVIYICAHGSGSYGPAKEYAFALDSTHYVTASELMSAIEKVKGRVVLIMDSCHSGGMIDCNRSRLDAQGGRISIIASSHRSTISSYWNASGTLSAVDFYTYALLQGIGFNESNGLGGARGWTIGYEPADRSGNNNGQVDLSELFAYAKSITVSNVQKYQKYSQFRGNPAQTPQSYIGSMNKDLIMFAW